MGGGDHAGSESGEDFEYVSAPSNLLGLARGQKAFLNSSRRIMKARDPLSYPHFIPSSLPFLTHIWHTGTCSARN